MKSLVIFDLDGTLLNTIYDLGEAANYALGRLGFPLHKTEAYPGMVGNGVTKLLERALPEDMRATSTIELMREHFSYHYDRHCTDNTSPYPGIPELLEELSSRGINLAVASNKYQKGVDILVRHFFPDANWKSVLGNCDGYPVKPDPSIVFRALAECPTPKQEVLYVGDSGIDMETARRACVESVGVTWGFRPVRELRDHYADHIISDPDDIITLTIG